MSAEHTSVDERLARAANTSDLSVRPDRRGDGYTLIAAGKTPRVVGRHLIALHGEWDGCAKPRRILDHDIAAIAKAMPLERPRLVLAHAYLDGWPKMEPKLREGNARAIARRWHEAECLNAYSRLKSLHRVRDGLVDVLNGRVKDPVPKVMALLAWWLDHICPTCNGTRRELMPGQKRLSDRACRSCGGTGERVLPYGADGRVIERAIDDCIGKARQQIDQFRRSLERHLKG
ncbi:hypothetical protein [Variovorax sp. ZT4R33]|uniref:hypothetical protein n=1 Tax=Variovorax sp. ZT4R33 TaxID=3443743 RepID=UPI003F46D878